ncbi:MAG: hypothetical protein AAF327_17600 [Cyanobacteria bacterium P01_A01_bin.37]
MKIICLNLCAVWGSVCHCCLSGKPLLEESKQQGSMVDALRPTGSIFADVHVFVSRIMPDTQHLPA